MSVELVTSEEVVVLARQALALPLTSTEASDDALLAALVRRAASIFCPCSPRTLENAVREHLEYLSESADDITTSIETAVEKATIAGDLLELSKATTNLSDVKSTWVFSASPAFVKRPNGSIILLGVSQDDPTPLPSTLNSRVNFDRHLRKIDALPGEDLGLTLRELGLIDLPERNWLKPPKQETAKEHLDRHNLRVQSQGPSGEVSDLEILDGEKSPTYYRGRWRSPRKDTGNFVARRPQAYGADLWGYAVLTDGLLQKFLDFPFKGGKARGCDCAWHLQMAQDACHGTPQRYRKRETSQGIIFDFFSPIPMWAERRLGLIGRTAERDHCLFSYAISEDDIAAEETFLQQCLWLTPDDAQERNS